MSAAGSSLPIQELAEFLAVVSTYAEPHDAMRAALEQAALALCAPMGAVVRDGVVLASTGFGTADVPQSQLTEIATKTAAVLDVPGLGRCPAISASAGGTPQVFLILARTSNAGFTAEDVNLVHAMARVLELTLESLRRLRAEQAMRATSEQHAAENAQLLASLRDRQHLLEHLSRIQRAISRRAPLQQILDCVVESARSLLHADVVTIRLLDPADGDYLLLAASDGLRPDLVIGARRARVNDGGVASRAIATGELVSAIYEAGSAAPDIATIELVRAAMAAPVHENDEIVGALVVATRDAAHRYEAADQELLRALAEHVTLAVTDARTLEAMYQAFHDSLTGLASRALFIDRLQHGLSGAQRSKTMLGLLFIDLDRFKMVNDTLGHQAGDQLLIEVADRVRGCLRASDTAARFGGDEFAVLLQDTSAAGAGRVADRVIDAVRAPYLISGREVFINASIGIALSSFGLNDAHELLRSADVAMYQAKRNGKGRHEIFEPGMRTELMQRLELEADLRRAIDGGEFVLHYQPIVALDTGRVTAVEALVRWHHPRRGLVMPMEFIPLAEETGLIVELGQWVLEEACRQTVRWHDLCPTDEALCISVNLSARQLEQRDIASHVADALLSAGLDASCLVLEITETLLVQDRVDTIAKMSELRSLGVRLAIDDFGTGYSSLSYLRQFPIDILKIDKSFVDGIGAGPEESAFARAIVRLGQTLHLEMIAEGIEQQSQVEELRRAKCQLGQGYHFARPMPAEQVTDLLSIDAVMSDNGERALPVLPQPVRATPVDLPGARDGAAVSRTCTDPRDTASAPTQLVRPPR